MARLTHIVLVGLSSISCAAPGATPTSIKAANLEQFPIPIGVGLQTDITADFERQLGRSLIVSYRAALAPCDAIDGDTGRVFSTWPFLFWHRSAFSLNVELFTLTPRLRPEPVLTRDLSTSVQRLLVAKTRAQEEAFEEAWLTTPDALARPRRLGSRENTTTEFSCERVYKRVFTDEETPSQVARGYHLLWEVTWPQKPRGKARVVQALQQYGASPDGKVSYAVQAREVPPLRLTPETLHAWSTRALTAALRSDPAVLALAEGLSAEADAGLPDRAPEPADSAASPAEALGAAR